MSSTERDRASLPKSAHFSLVLVEPQGPVNLGACARLCENFGIDDWSVVRPKCAIDDRQALEYATGPSRRRFDELRVFETLGGALEGTHLSVGFCGKVPGRKGPPPITPAELCEAASGAPPGGERYRIGLVFGNERVGLSVDDLILCSRHCRIPTGEFDSLNLSHAVAVVASRLFEARASASSGFSAGCPERKVERISPATREELEAMYAQGRDFLSGLGYVTAGNPDRLLLLFRRIFDRAALKANEVKALRSVFSQAMRRRA